QLVALRRQAINPPTGHVAHAVAADAGVVPVGDEDAAVRGDADVAGPEPGIGAGDEILLLHIVAGAFGLQVIAADVPRAGVGVQELAVVFLGQERPLVDAHAGRRAESGAEDFRHDAGL